MTTAWVFDNAGFLTPVTSTKNGATLDSHTYQRDAVGNITQETLAGANPGTSLFGYDDAYRLTSATVNGTNYTWSYDQVGNRLSQTAGGVTTPYTYNAADQLTSVNGATVTSDLDGNVTNDGAGGVYTWDARSRLTGLTKNGTSYVFKYGFDNLRLYKSVNGVATTYLLDGQQVVTEKINGVANQTLYGPGTDHPLARNGEFFLPNHESSTTGLTDSSGNLTQSYLYGPFGELLAPASLMPTDSNPFQYTGRENDGDGLLYYRARYYCPAWGRFLSSDPAGFGGGINPFVYAHDNPVNVTDPSGQFSLLAALLLIPEGSVAGPVIGAVVVTAAAAVVISGAIQLVNTVVMQSASEGSNDGPYSSGSDSGGSGSGSEGGGSGTAGSGGNSTGGTGGTAGPTGDGDEEPGNTIWRSGKPNPSNLIDPEGLSFRDSLTDPLPPENPVFTKPEYFGIDTSLLPPDSVVYDNIPDGHVTVYDVDVQTLKDAVVVRGKFPADFPPGW